MFVYLPLCLPVCLSAFLCVSLSLFICVSHNAVGEGEGQVTVDVQCESLYLS